MTVAATLLATVQDLGATLAVAGDRLRVDAPAGVLGDFHWRALADHKAELLAILAPAPPPGSSPAAPEIDIPPAWPWIVANWPHGRWVEWRRPAGEIEPPDATADQIRDAGWRAYVELTRVDWLGAASFTPLARVARVATHCNVGICFECQTPLTWASAVSPVRPAPEAWLHPGAGWGRPAPLREVHNPVAQGPGDGRGRGRTLHPRTDPAPWRTDQWHSAVSWPD